MRGHIRKKPQPLAGDGSARHHCSSLEKGPEQQNQLSGSRLAPGQHTRFSAQGDTRADVNKRLHKAASRKAPPAGGQALPSRSGWLCQKGETRVAAGTDRHGTHRALGTGGYRQSCRCPEAGSARSPGHLPGPGRCCSHFPKLLPRENGGHAAVPGPSDAPFAIAAADGGRQSRAAAPAPAAAAQRTRSARQPMIRPARRWSNAGPARTRFTCGVNRPSETPAILYPHLQPLTAA